MAAKTRRKAKAQGNAQRAGRLTATRRGRDFISSPEFGEILRSVLRDRVEKNESYGLTYLTWVCITASCLAGRTPPQFATAELRRFAARNRGTIERALAPYMEELDAAPLMVFDDGKVSDWWGLLGGLPKEMSRAVVQESVQACLARASIEAGSKQRLPN